MRGRGLGMHFCRVLTERKIMERQLESFWGKPQGIFLSGTHVQYTQSVSSRPHV